MNQKLFETQKAFEKIQLAKTSEEMIEPFAKIDTANTFSQDRAVEAVVRTNASRIQNSHEQTT